MNDYNIKLYNKNYKQLEINPNCYLMPLQKILSDCEIELKLSCKIKTLVLIDWMIGSFALRRRQQLTFLILNYKNYQTFLS